MRQKNADETEHIRNAYMSDCLMSVSRSMTDGEASRVFIILQLVFAFDLELP